MTDTFCPRCGASPAGEPCPTCGFTPQTTLRDALSAGVLRVRRSPAIPLTIWGVTIPLIWTTLTIGGRVSRAGFPMDAWAAGIGTWVSMVLAFAALALHGAWRTRRSPAVLATTSVVFQAGTRAALPWALALVAGAYTQSRPFEDVGAAWAWIAALVLLGVGIMSAARTFPVPVLAGAGPVSSRMWRRARDISRARGGLGLTIIGASLTFLAAAIAGAIAANVVGGGATFDGAATLATPGLRIITAVQLVVVWIMATIWGAWAVEAVLGDGSGMPFGCPNCGHEARALGEQASCAACGAKGTLTAAP